MDENFENRVRDFQQRVAAERAVGWQLAPKEVVVSRRAEFRPVPFSPIENSSSQKPVIPGTGGLQTSGAFSGLLTLGSTTWLQGGTVSAGVGSESLPNYNVSAVTGDSILWVEISVDAIKDEANEIIIAGLKVTSASYGRGASVPNNDFPTVTSPGKVYIEVGRWIGGTFLPSSSGNINLRGCTGNVDIQRN